MPPAADNQDMDRYDLISDDLEEHILKHPQGAACLQLLYELFDNWTGLTLFEESLRTRGGLKSRKGGRERADKAIGWYLANALRVQKASGSTSYSQLSVPLALAAQADPSARKHVKSDETIRGYLNNAAREWYAGEARHLAKSDPELSTDQVVLTLIDRARVSGTVFFLSRKSDVAQYLSDSYELWYVRRGAKAVLEDPSITRKALADRLRGEAVREAEQYFRPLETVLGYLEDAELGVS
jgi:hypothetical protein